MWDKGFIWNPSNSECECDKLCDVGEYWDYENCKCWKRLIDKLAEKCNENIDRNEMISVILNYWENVRGSCTVYIVLFVIFFIISISISIFYVYFLWYLSKSSTNITNINAATEAAIY